MPLDPNHDDWSSLSANYVQFWRALNMRLVSLGGTALPEPAAGCDVQYAGSSAPAHAYGSFSVSYLQGQLESIAQSDFVPYDINPPGLAVLASWNYTLAKFRSAAGLNASGFTRERPREIGMAANGSTSSASADVYGNAAANGQSAYGIRTISSTSDVSGSPSAGALAVLASAPDGNVLEYRPSRTPLWQTPLNLARSEVQSLGIVGASSGTFTLTFTGFTTSALAYNASAATVQAALRALDPFAGGNVTCTGGPLSTATITVTYSGLYASAPVPLLQGTSVSLNAGFISIAQTTEGRSGVRPDCFGVFQHNGTQWAKVTPSATTFTNVDTISSSAGQMPYGRMLPGDYFHATLWDELVSCFGALRWATHAVSNTVDTAEWYGMHVNGVYPDVSTLFAAAEATWSERNSNFPSDPTDAAIWTQVRFVGAGVFQSLAEGQCVRRLFRITNPNLANYSVAMDVYHSSLKGNFAAASSDETYDTNGLPLVQDQNALTHNGITPESGVWKYYPASNILPNWAGAGPANAGQGVVIGNARVILKFDYDL
jgi:hypothetical protein